MTRHAITLLIAAAALAAGCGRTTNPAEWSTRIEPIASPAAGSSMEPQLTMSSRGVILSWVEQTGETATLKFAERTADGWTPARTVASGDDWFLSYADMPSVLRLDDGTLVANWLKTTNAQTEAYDLLLSYSRDDGKTWAAPFTPHHDGTKTLHGFASLVQMPGGGLGVVYLDGRDVELSTSFDGGSMAVRFAEYDSSWKQVADLEVNPRVCECCPTTAVVTADGLLTAFRDRSKDEIRDIHVSRFDNGKWTIAVPVHNDNWEILACPVNGPMLSARGKDVVAAWFTARDDRGRAFVAFSEDAGGTWSTPVRLDDNESLGRVGVDLLDDGSAVATWIEYADKTAQIRMRRVDRSGARSPAITIAGLGSSRASGYPRIARNGDELILAWTESVGEEGNQSVKTAVARVQ